MLSQLHELLPERWLPGLLCMVLALMLLEAVWLLSRRQRDRARLGALAAGAGLLLAWLLYLWGWPSLLVTASLAIAGICHVLAWWSVPSRRRDAQSH
jgi:chromate transport protein ChrA